MIYAGRTYASAVSGSTTKRIECEKCRTEYFYVLSRVGTGQGTSPYFLNNRGAASRAERAAEAALAKRLQRESEPVPCPKCGWIQSHMVLELRRVRHRWMFKLAVATMGFVLPILAVIFVAVYLDSPREAMETLPGMAVIGVPVVVVGIGLLLLRRALVGRIDPNRSYPRPPQELPGTPPALVPAGAADAGGDVQLVPARPFAPRMEDGWLAWRFSADAFAPQCCVCLGPYERDFATPLDTSANLRVPLCAACHRTIALRWWGYTLQCIAASVAVMGLVAWLVPGPDDVGRYVIWAFGGLVLSIVTLASIPRLRVMPYRLKGYDGHRGVGWLKYDNPDYTRRLAESVQREPAAEPAATARATQIA